MMHCNKMVATIKVNGEVLREMNGTVYLPFGSEYSIYLKNLNSRRAVVNITIDDEDVLSGSELVVDANSTLELKRWLVDNSDCGPALKFVEKTDEIRDRVGENDGMDGVIKITYQYELPIVSALPFSQPDVWYTSPYDYNKPPSFHYSANTPLSAFRSVNSDLNVDGNVLNSVTTCSCNQNEDGFTVKGDDVDQKFKKTIIRDLEYQKNVITFMLKGGDPKAFTVKTKITCKKCYAHNKWNANFCSCCGNNLKY